MGRAPVLLEAGKVENCVAHGDEAAAIHVNRPPAGRYIRHEAERQGDQKSQSVLAPNGDLDCWIKHMREAVPAKASRDSQRRQGTAFLPQLTPHVPPLLFWYQVFQRERGPDVVAV
jgi:hypothetical protein